jgi:two-component system sensor histidine kinase KdpD
MKSTSRYAAGLLLILGATLAGEVVRLHLSPPNMVMLYLLAVVLASLKLGLRPAVFTAAAGVLAFDFFFVPPRFSLTVADKEYLVTFLGFFVVGVVISSLVSRTRERAEELREREAETAALYRLSRDIAAAPDSAAVFSAIVRNAEDFFSTSAAILLPDDNGLRIAAAGAGLELSGNDLELAQWSLKSLRRAGPGSASFPDTSLLCLPLVALGQCIALLVLSAAGKSISEDSRLDRVIDGFAVQLKMALVRLELSHQAEQAQILQARENLERALLNSISHDLRSPLSTVTGVLSSLKDEGTHLSDRARGELLETACSEAERLNRFVGNLLDMTRIEAGAIRLNVELCDVQDLVGCALAAIEQRTGGRTISISLADELPPISMDLVLLTQVLVNLLDNAHKYAPPETVIEVTAAVDGDWLVMEVGDQGPGVPEHDLKRVFDKFYRIPVPEGAGGTGLGLSICKGIVEAHGGRISAENRAGGGLRVVVRMPLPVADEGVKDDN